MTEPTSDASSPEGARWQVGCEGADGLLRIHATSETCDVCAVPALSPLQETTDGCAICRQQGSNGHAHWAWHKFCRAELNPVTLYQYAHRFDPSGRLSAHIAALTGMDEAAVSAALASEGGIEPGRQETTDPRCTCWLGRPGAYGGSSDERIACAVHGDKARAETTDPRIAEIRATLKATRGELWATYGETPRVQPLFAQIDSALRQLDALRAAREAPECWHGHKRRQVGCVSCVLVFDRAAAPEKGGQ